MEFNLRRTNEAESWREERRWGGRIHIPLQSLGLSWKLGKTEVHQGGWEERAVYKLNEELGDAGQP